jgi:hypothetical protein
MNPSCRARECRITKVFGNAALMLSLFCAACSFDYGSLQGGNPGVGGEGGGSGLGGTMDSGGTTSTGGIYSTGGTILQGGSTGGIYSTGGTISKGGSNNSGGIYSAGGMTAKGGSQSSGGITTSPSGGVIVVSSGGAIVLSSGGATVLRSGGTSVSPSGGTSVVSSGGVASGGGVTSPGGSTSSTPTGTTVTFASGKAVGAMTGYGWVALGSADTITDPTCGASKALITVAAPCAANTNWSSTTALCITGSIPALGTPPDYTANYGVVVGVNSTDPPIGGLGQSFTSITITTTGGPGSGVRAQIHKKGDPDNTSYCFPFTSGTAMALAKFAIDCYNTTPLQVFSAADIPNIDKISLEAFSSTAAITVTNLCMTGISFQ